MTGQSECPPQENPAGSFAGGFVRSSILRFQPSRTPVQSAGWYTRHFNKPLSQLFDGGLCERDSIPLTHVPWAYIIRNFHYWPSGPTANIHLTAIGCNYCGPEGCARSSDEPARALKPVARSCGVSVRIKMASHRVPSATITGLCQMAIRLSLPRAS